LAQKLKHHPVFQALLGSTKRKVCTHPECESYHALRLLIRNELL